MPKARTEDQGAEARVQAGDDAERATGAQKAPKPKSNQVRMRRDPKAFPAPHTASVHVDEVSNWAKHGWERE